MANSQESLIDEVAPLVISELMSDNANTITTVVRESVDQSFQGTPFTPDWVEIHNVTDRPADLGGYHLTDDLRENKKWEIPEGTRIPAGEYLLVFASGLDIRDTRLDQQGALHTNFRLSRGAGSNIALTDAGGEILFSLTDMPVQDEDISYGTDQDGTSRYYTVPTPGERNADEIPIAPVINVASTTFTDSFAVEIIPASSSHAVHYTLDGRTPTDRSAVYSGPITIGGTTQLRALSIEPNGRSSKVVSQTYIDIENDVLDNNSDLPFLIVDVFGEDVRDGSPFGEAFVAIIEPSQSGRSRLGDPFSLATRAGIHIRGNSSAFFPKKQYRVEFWDERNEDRGLQVLGMPEEADWIFYGPGSYDRALINNPLMYDLSNQIGRYASRTRWVEMYLNTDGTLDASDYVGVYAIIEPIEKGDDRVDVERLSDGADGSPVEGGFIWKNDWDRSYVDPEFPTSAQRDYIDHWIDGLLTAAAADDFKSVDVGYERYADVTSFIDHHILNLLSKNEDALRASSFYHKTADGKLMAGPIWDFDRTFDSLDNQDDDPRSWQGPGDATRFFDDGDRVMTWWPNMFQDPDFVQRYIDRWFELRSNQLSLDNIYATIDTHAAAIAEAAERDYNRWSDSRFGDFAGEIRHMKYWISQRVQWIDSQWLPAPTFNVVNSQVAAGTPVKLSSNGTPSVYYTLDGTDPRGEDGEIARNAILAEGPILIDGVTHITARAYERSPRNYHGYETSGDDWSPPAAKIYYSDPLAAAGNLVISEVHYNPAEPTGAEVDAGFDNNDDFEFIEITNVSNGNVVLTGAKLARVDLEGEEEGIDFDFSESHITSLGPRERILVVEDSGAFNFRYGGHLPVAGQWSGRLSNNGETLTLKARDDSIIQQFKFNDGGNWPRRADGDGSSLELINSSGAFADATNWRASVDIGGTPGSEPSNPIGVVINEVLAHTDPPRTPADSIELLNNSTDTVDIGGWYLSDSIDDLLKFRIPEGTTLAPSEYIVFDENDFRPSSDSSGAKDFGLSGARGDDVWLVVPDELGGAARFVDDVHFPATRNGESMGRVPNGTGQLAPMSTLTLGASNANPRVGPVVVSELNFHPGNPSGNAASVDPGITPDDLEFVEIFNPTESVIDLTDWRVRGGVDIDFVPGTQLPSHATLLVLSFDPNNSDNANRLAAFRAHYQLGNSARLAGGYSGRLSDSGESIRLQRPDNSPSDEPWLIPRLLEDEVVYDDVSPWPSASGNGNSISRVDSTAFGRSPSSWRADAPSPGIVPGRFIPSPAGDNHSTPDGESKSEGETEVTVHIQDIVPNPRLRPVPHITLVFSEQVQGFDISDLMFSLNGNPIHLEDVATLTTQDEITWSLEHLEHLTDQPGVFQIDLIAEHSGITGLGGAILIHGVSATWTDDRQPGDSNLDGQFDQFDLIAVLREGKFLKPEPADWSQGDWNGDGRFDQLDLLASLQTGNHRKGPYAADAE